MEKEALTVVYLYMGIGAILLIVTLVIVIARKANRVLDKIDVLTLLMIGHEEEKEKTDDGRFETGEFQVPRRE